jgi:hypothetical protein
LDVWTVLTYLYKELMNCAPFSKSLEFLQKRTEQSLGLWRIVFQALRTSLLHPSLRYNSFGGMSTRNDILRIIIVAQQGFSW